MNKDNKKTLCGIDIGTSKICVLICGIIDNNIEILCNLLDFLKKINNGKTIINVLIIIFNGEKKFYKKRIIFLFCYLGSFFSEGNGKIYTVIFTFFIGLYLSKKISQYINNNTNNKIIKFFV